MKTKSNILKVPLLACFLLVLLRMSIGWQFYYEGIWKLKTLSTATPWTSAEYLKNAKGPFRDYFRDMVEDPNDLDKLDYEKMSARWDRWAESFTNHYKDLNENQLKRLNDLLADAKKKLKEQLTENPEWAGVVREKFKGTIDEKTKGELELYRNMLVRYEEKLERSAAEFERNHLDKIWSEIQAKRTMLTGPVNAMTAELQSSASKLLTLDQLGRGVPQPEQTKTSKIDRNTIWALIIIGGLMIAGLFSRLSALAAAGLLTMFYLVMPPFPGVPEAPGPEHSLIVNKNFIEIVACLALACLPTGRWIGLDAFVRRFILRRTTD